MSQHSPCSPAHTTRVLRSRRSAIAAALSVSPLWGMTSSNHPLTSSSSCVWFYHTISDSITQLCEKTHNAPHTHGIVSSLSISQEFCSCWAFSSPRPVCARTTIYLFTSLLFDAHVHRVSVCVVGLHGAFDPAPSRPHLVLPPDGRATRQTPSCSRCGGVNSKRFNLGL